MTARGQITSPEDARRFLHAGNATLTIQSEATGQRYTFKVRKSEDGQKEFVSMLAGPDNSADFVYVGLLAGEDLRLTRKSKLGDDALPVRAFRYMAGNLAAGRIAPKLAIYHEGKCGRCGRKLTVPSSIENGIGPECAKHMH